MTIPFYADIEVLAEDNFKSDIWGWVVTLIYFALTYSTFKALNYFDQTNEIWIKVLGFFIAIGIPLSIALKVKRDVWRLGGSRLKNLYLKNSAYHGIGTVFVLIAWLLFGRWIAGDPIWNNLALALAPSLMFLSIYFSVRRELKKTKVDS